MRRALERVGEVTLLSHHVSSIPTFDETCLADQRRVEIGTQPVSIHGEALAAGWLHRRRLRSWKGAWCVNSRYAGALFASGVPYIVWEATTVRDELTASTVADVRRSATGSGAGYVLHRALLPLGERLEGRILRAAKAVFAMSDYTRERLLKIHGLAGEHVRVLAHPAGPEFTKHLRRRSVVEGVDEPASKRPWRLLFVGRADDSRKNFSLLPEVLQRIQAAGYSATLTAIGKHNETWRESLSLGGDSKITFFGAVPIKSLAAAYQSHDLMLVPSRQEGFGIVVAEAFAAGLPVVSTRCGGPEHVITESGAGELVNVDADEMAAAIIRLMTNPCLLAQMRERALEYYSGHLLFDKFAESVERITRDVLLQ
jgi:glycosyltransferase involved in cell wall biosynthesis